MKRASFFARYPVPIAFLLLCAFFASYAHLGLPFVLVEMTNRLARNMVLTLSLVIPVVAGLGLNFGIVLGAMAGQAALILVRHWQIGGMAGFLLAGLLATPTAIVLGWLVGRLLNRAKGREMITGIIASFFANGLYSLVFLFAVGAGPAAAKRAAAGGGYSPVWLVVLVGLAAVIWQLARSDRTDSTPGLEAPVSGPPPAVRWTFYGVVGVLLAVNVVGLVQIENPEIVQPQGYGLRTSVNLDWQATSATATAPERAVGKITGALDSVAAVKIQLSAGTPGATEWQLPLGTFMAAGLVCFAIHFLLGTKLGQEMRALGQDMHIAGVLGIGVDRTRVIAIILSTVLAAWGQMVFLQNLGTINVFSSHEQVGMMSVAALLIGGASAAEAKITHALLGTLLLHLLMLLSAAAGPNLFPDNKTGAAQLGEYVRCSAAYGVIALALALHAYKEARRKAAATE